MSGRYRVNGTNKPRNGGTGTPGVRGAQPVGSSRAGGRAGGSNMSRPANLHGGRPAIRTAPPTAGSSGGSSGSAINPGSEDDPDDLQRLPGEYIRLQERYNVLQKQHQVLQQESATRTESDRRRQAAESDVVEPVAKRQKRAPASPGSLAGKKFAVFFCMWATVDEIFKEEHEGGREDVPGEAVLTVDQVTEPDQASNEGTPLSRNNTGRELEGEQSLEPGMGDGDGEESEEEGDEGDEKRDSFMEICPAVTADYDLMTAKGRLNFIQAKVALFHAQATQKELKGWGSKDYKQDFMDGMSKMRSIIKAYITAEPTLFGFQFNDEERERWINPSKRIYLPEVKPLSNDKYFCWPRIQVDEVLTAEEKTRRLFRDPGLIKILLRLLKGPSAFMSGHRTPMARSCYETKWGVSSVNIEALAFSATIAISVLRGETIISSQDTQIYYWRALRILRVAVSSKSTVMEALGKKIHDTLGYTRQEEAMSREVMEDDELIAAF